CERDGRVRRARRYAEAEERFEEASRRYDRLASADTSNAESRVYMARSGRGAGEACDALSRAARSPAERRRWRTHALSWLEQSRYLYRERAKDGAIKEDDDTATPGIDHTVS